MTPWNVPPGKVTPRVPGVVPEMEGAVVPVLPVMANLPIMMRAMVACPQSMPSWRVMVRDMVAMRTFSSTWIGSRTWSWLTTAPLGEISRA